MSWAWSQAAGVRTTTSFITAHWDHLGVKPDVAGPDKIYNGAIDNGMGVSTYPGDRRGVLPKAGKAAALHRHPLLDAGRAGAARLGIFRQAPIWPLTHIVGGVNLDGGLPEGSAHDMVLVGNGASELEDVLAEVLKTQNRTISPDPEPEKGYFYRSDHISLAKVGVPMLDPDGGFDLVNGGTKAGQAVRDDYTAHRYHQPSDEFDPHWDLSGPLEDACRVLRASAASSRDKRSWPNWYKDNEFRQIRERSLAK